MAHIKANAHEMIQGQIYTSFASTYYQTICAVCTRDSRKKLGDFGFAWLSEANFSNGALEIGLFYMNKSYVTLHSSQQYIFKSKRLMMTTGYKYWVTDRLGLAISLVSSYSAGDPITVADTVDADEIATAASIPGIVGVDVSASLDLGSFSSYILFSELRAARMKFQKSDFELDHVMLSIGLKFLVPKSRL